MKNLDAGIYRVGNLFAVTSSTEYKRMFVDNEFVEVLHGDAAAAQVGAAVRLAWVASCNLPPLSAQAVQPVLKALGFRSFSSLLKSGTVHASASVIEGKVKIQATENEGPRGSFNVIEKFEGLALDASDEELGDLVIKALERSR